MYASIAAVVLIGFALAWTALNKSGIPAFSWYISLVLIGAAAIVFWLRPRRMLSPPLPKWLTWTIRGLLLYLVFQAIPLPVGLLNILSPARGKLTQALAPIVDVRFAPISVDPAAHILWSFTIAGCTVAFFLLRDLTFRMRNRVFVVLLPLFLVAGFEALLGLLQVAGGAVQAVGSYNSRDHYCCILEQTMPVAIALGLVYFSRRGSSSIWPVLQAIACWLLAALLALAIMASLSRGGWFDSIFSLIVLANLLLFPRIPSFGWRVGILGGLLVVVVGVFVFSSPGPMLVRLVSVTEADTDARLYIWKALPPLIREFCWFGTGLMGFDPVFLKYQDVVNSRRIDFAHNDFFQYLIELGVVGFIPLMTCLGALVWEMAKKGWKNAAGESENGHEKRLLLAGCLASFSALFLHSIVDFNLYIPANMFTFAWILGFGAALAAVPAGTAHD